MSKLNYWNDCAMLGFIWIVFVCLKMQKMGNETFSKICSNMSSPFENVQKEPKISVFEDHGVVD